MKILNGSDLADFIKERQARQVRSLRGAKIFPKLAIFYDNDSPVIAKYMSLKERYGTDIGIDTEIIKITPENAEEQLQKAANDEKIHGIIVQLPLKVCDIDILNLIPLEKDVDGLRGETDTATAIAIHWLLTSYDLNKLIDYDVIVTATGVPGVIKTEMIKQGAVVVDAGTASEGGVIKGDLDEAVRERTDLTITPKIGGVGPLTVSMLFDQVLQKAELHRK